MGNGYSKRCQCVTRRILDKNIPKRFKTATIESFIPRDDMQQAAKDAMLLKPAGSYFVFGPYGRGKTHLMYAQYRALVERGERCFIRTTRELARELTDDELDGWKSSPLLNAIESVHRIHLFWDDADKMKPTDFKEEVFFDLVDKLYKHDHGITVTSNLNLQQLGNVFLPAIIRRIDDICEIIEL